MISPDTAQRIISAGRLLTAPGMSALRRLARETERGGDPAKLETALSLLEELANPRITLQSLQGLTSGGLQIHTNHTKNPGKSAGKGHK